VRQLARRVERVDVDDHVARAQDGGQRDHHLRHVGHHQRDPRAGLQAERLQPGADRARLRLDLREGERVAHEEQLVALCMALEGVLEQVDQAGEGGGPEIGRHAVGILVQPGAGGAHVHVVPRG
jgi:hypothetical protein